MKKPPIPTHDFYDRLERTIPFDLVTLKKKTGYDSSEAHRHSYYEIFYFAEGSGTHDIDFETFPVQPCSLHFVSPGQTHLVKRSNDSSGYVVLFSRDFFQLGLQNQDTLYELPFLNNNSPRPVLSIPENDKIVFADLFRKMEEEYRSENPYRENILRSYLNILLLQSKRIFSPAEQGQPSPATAVSRELLGKFKVSVEKNFMHMHKPGEYASLLCVTPGHLNDVVKKHLGISAGEVIQERLILEIKRLLLHSAESVNAIADMLSFDDPSYFTRFFKKHTGISPGDFREEMQKKYF